jgi:radical SAM protein with 4Fe4S-binding SPASM domain
MYCKLCGDVFLRSWLSVPYAYYRRGETFVHELEKDEFELLQKCNGEQKLEETTLLLSLLRRGLLCEIDKPDFIPVDYRFCANRYFSRINWMITGRCNLNCRHCFNATDNGRIKSEFSWDECVLLLNDAQKCGVLAFTLTGGEPMMHPHFLNIIRSVYDRNMVIAELNTNGDFITQSILDEMKNIGCRPLIKISFDGIGHHDWLRNQTGAEKRALEAIKLCISNNMPVMVQTNINSINVASILPTIDLMDSIGVVSTRIIRTSESPRWLENSDNQCLSFELYYEESLKIAEAYIAKPHTMDVNFWQFLDIYPISRTYRLSPVVGDNLSFNSHMPVCEHNRAMVGITSSGDLVPCNQLSGLFKKQGISLGNIFKSGLQQLLLDSSYLDAVCMPVARIIGHNEQCQKCIYWQLCLGGCRAIAMAFNKNYYSYDPAKCSYFHGGWIEKTQKAMNRKMMNVCNE